MGNTLTLSTILIVVLLAYAVINYFSFPFDVSKFVAKMVKNKKDEEIDRRFVVALMIAYQYVKLAFLIGAVCWAEYLICAKHFMSGE